MTIEPEYEPEPIPVPVPTRKKKARKDFEIGVCIRCGQLLLDDPDNTRIKIDEELCEDCDTTLRANYNQYKNFALAKALRAHKHLK
ncbi:MAG: hypothetical protein JJE45_00255 [Prolixibacteraceae bacterium]|nr:hypothetical protein [Prolixibacteraceae bacterium]